MASFQDQAELGAFISTTPDVSTPNSLQSAINNMALLLNIKDTGYYVEQEFVCGQVYFPNPALTATAPASGQNPLLRQVFRKVVNFGGLPNAGTTNVAHDINVLAANGATNYDGFTFTRIYGVASDTTNRDFIPLPYIAGNNGTSVALDVDQTNVSITTTDDKTTFDTTYVVLEYIKD